MDLVGKVMSLLFNMLSRFYLLANSLSIHIKMMLLTIFQKFFSISLLLHRKLCVHAQSHPTLCQTVALQAPLSMEFPRQEYWSRLPLPPPGDLPDLGIELESPVSPALERG